MQDEMGNDKDKRFNQPFSEREAIAASFLMS